MMVSYGVNTLISDSGVIKYRIISERWEVNTVKNPSRWIFEKGIFMEQYDKTFHVEGYIQADTAWYYDQLKLWELRGRVTIRNVNGLVFRSEELFWDGIKHEFYSHQFSRLVTPERTLEGTYFRSDEQMMHYEVVDLEHLHDFDASVDHIIETENSPFLCTCCGRRVHPRNVQYDYNTYSFAMQCGRCHGEVVRTDGTCKNEQHENNR